MNSRIYSRQELFVCPEQFLGQTKTSSLRDLCGSVVNAINFGRCLPTTPLTGIRVSLRQAWSLEAFLPSEPLLWAWLLP
jgi:hypothetical protein